MPGRKKDVNVIDDDIIIQAVKVGEEFEGNGEGSKRLEEIEQLISNNGLLQLFRTCTVARFSFMRIAAIQNLNCFSGMLTKLCLDNNLLEEIDHIDHLTSLKWLDLSFNRIKVVKGLNALVNLVDLSLYSNQIRVIDGLDQCHKLECLSVGKNQISSLDILTTLRPIHLKMLTLHGNPVCDEAEYGMMALAFLPDLRYLDHALVDRDDVNTAREQYQDELIDIEEKERLESEKRNKDEAKNKHIEILTEAEAKFGACLFDDVISNDIELLKLRNAPGVPGKIEKFRERFKESADNFIEACIQKNSLRKAAHAQFTTAINGLYEENDALCRSETEKLSAELKILSKAREAEQRRPRGRSPKRMIGDRTDQLNGISADLDSRTRKKSVSGQIFNFADKFMEIKQIMNLTKNTLMRAELCRIEAFETMTDALDTKWGEFRLQFLELHQTFFRSSELIIDSLSSEVHDIITALVEKISQEESHDDDIEENTQSLLGDKESVLSILTASHDLQVGKLLKCEDEGRIRLIKSAAAMFEGIRLQEHEYSRKRILEISEMITNSTMFIQELEKSYGESAKKTEDEDEFD